MRLLVWIALVLSLGYGGFWFAASSTLRDQAGTALDDLRARGLVDYGDLSVAGFPSRLDLTLTEPRARTADGNLSWAAPFVQVLALAYRPNRVIMVWPNEQTLTTPFETVAIRTTRMRASAAFGASLDLPLDHATIEIDEAAASSDAGWSARVSRGLVATRLAGTPLAHDLYVDVLGFDMPGRIEGPGTARADATVTFDRPLDRVSGPPRVTALSLRDARLAFGTASLSLSGDLTVSAGGTPEGRLTLTATEWRRVLDLLASAGLLRREILPTWENALSQLSQASDTPDTVSLPLTLANGRVSLGPLPLGPVPRLPGY